MSDTNAEHTTVVGQKKEPKYEEEKITNERQTWMEEDKEDDDGNEDVRMSWMVGSRRSRHPCE